MDGNIPVLAKRNNRCCEHSIEAIGRQAGSSQRDVCVSCWYNSFKLRACSATWNRVRNFATGRKVCRDAPMTKVGTPSSANARNFPSLSPIPASRLIGDCRADSKCSSQPVKQMRLVLKALKAAFSVRALAALLGAGIGFGAEV